MEDNYWLVWKTKPARECRIKLFCVCNSKEMCSHCAVSCQDKECSTCLFLRESWDTWSLETLSNVPTPYLQEKLWLELLDIGAQVNDGNSEEFLVHLAERFHLYLLFIEERFEKGVLCVFEIFCHSKVEDIGESPYEDANQVCKIARWILC